METQSRAPRKGVTPFQQLVNEGMTEEQALEKLGIPSGETKPTKFPGGRVSFEVLELNEISQGLCEDREICYRNEAVSM